MGTEARTDAVVASIDADRRLDLFGEPLVAALDDDEAGTRRAAARALCLLAASDDDGVETVALRLVARLSETDSERPFLRTLATLAGLHDDAVFDALNTADVPDEIIDAVDAADPWAFDVRSDGGGASATAALRQVVDPDGGSGAGGGTDVIQRNGPGTRQWSPTGTTAEDAASDGVGSDSTGKQDDGGSDAADDRRTLGRRRDPAAAGRRKRIERIQQSRAFRAIRMESRFDDLEVVEPEQAVRYGSVLRTRATVDGDYRGVTLRLFDRPESGDARRSFAAAVAEHLAQWDGVADHDGVAPVHDWGDYPRPWLGTGYVEGTLEDRGRASPARALREAAHLAGAVAHVHRNGVVHAGIDPPNVVYPATPLRGLPAPQLDNVGLMGAFREHFQPADYLDPRYAAPEYFDRDYGTIDQATDVYQLGTVLYRLLTGRAPFAGDYATIREAVLDEPPTPPTELDPSLPDGLDDVIAKTTAKRKLTRYETAAAVRRDCWRLAQQLDD